MKFNYKKIIEDVISKNFWSRIIIMTISIFFLALNYNLFLLANNLVTGGTSGLATIVNHLFGCDPAVFMLIFNCFLIFLSFIFLGSKSTGLTIIGSILYPLFVSMTKGLATFLGEYIILDNFLLVVIISGCIYGFSNGFIYKTGFTTGGGDIIIQIISKYLKIPTGNASLFVNLIIISFGALVFGINKAIYAVLIIFINSNLVDKIMLGISDSKMFYIFTKKPEEVIDFIKGMESGYTLMKTDGGYTKEKKNIIMCVIPTKDYYMFNNCIKKIDPSAFLIISDCYQVYGGHRKNNLPFI